MSTAFEPQAFFEELKKRKNSDLNGQRSGKSEPNGPKGRLSRPSRAPKTDVFDRKC